MAGTALSLFTEFVNITGPTFLTSTKEVVNDAQKTNYNTLGYLLRGQGMADVLQGGSEIRDYIFLEAVRRARSYKPTQTQQYAITQTGTPWSIPWRFFLNDLSWADETVVLNAGAQMNSAARKEAYKSLWYRMQQNLYTDQMNYWEEVYWAVPNAPEMESATGQEMYSIPALVNEFTNGLPSAAHPGGAWTTVMGINPTTAGQTKWVPQRFGYGTGGAGYTVNNSANVITFLDQAFKKLDFRRPPMKEEYFDNDAVGPVGCIFTSMLGVTKLMQLFRASQDRWVDSEDPFNNPTYKGAPIVYIGQLDDAAIFPTGAAGALATETSAANTNSGPRYFLIQPSYLRPVFHSERYMENLGVMTDVTQPTVHTMPINTYANLCVRSRIRHAVLYPVANNA